MLKIREASERDFDDIWDNIWPIFQAISPAGDTYTTKNWN